MHKNLILSIALLYLTAEAADLGTKAPHLRGVMLNSASGGSFARELGNGGFCNYLK